MVRLYDAYGWFAFRDGHSLADCWIEQSYKERICEEVKKIDDLEMLQFIWKILRNLREDEEK